MQLGRWLGGTIVALTVGTAVWGAAASLGGLAAETLGAGSAPVLSCDTDGLDVSYTTSGGKVTAVTVSAIADPTCEGGRLSLTLSDDATGIGSGGPTTVATDGDTSDNSVTVSVSPQPSAELVDGIHVAIIGP